MAGSKESEAASPAVISRRDAIVGALAVATGTLVASKPDVAQAASGDTMYVGTDMVSTTITSVTRQTTDPVPDDLSYAFLNHNWGDQEVGLYGGVTALGAAGSTGVYGLASLKGQYGVQAENVDGGTALKVLGKTQFQRSGKSTVTKGHSTRTVTVPVWRGGVGTGSMIHVTLQGSGGAGVYLRYASRLSSSTFHVVLNKAATKTVSFAWFITD